EPRTAEHGPFSGEIRFDDITNLSGLIQLAVNEGKKPGGKFNFLLEPLIEGALNAEQSNSRRLVAELLKKFLRELEPNHPLVRDPSAPDYVPTEEDLALLHREHAAAEMRAKQRKAFRARSLGGE